MPILYQQDLTDADHSADPSTGKGSANPSADFSIIQRSGDPSADPTIGKRSANPSQLIL